MKRDFLAKQGCTVFALMAMILVTGCAPRKQIENNSRPPPEYKPEGARLSSTEAIRLAKQEAIRQGINLRHFKEPYLSYYSDRRDWFLLFWGKRQRFPGDHFSVDVDDQTGKARFMGGR